MDDHKNDDLGVNLSNVITAAPNVIYEAACQAAPTRFIV